MQAGLLGSQQCLEGSWAGHPLLHVPEVGCSFVVSRACIYCFSCWWNVLHDVCLRVAGCRVPCDPAGDGKVISIKRLSPLKAGPGTWQAKLLRGKGGTEVQGHARAEHGQDSAWDRLTWCSMQHGETLSRRAGVTTDLALASLAGSRPWDDTSVQSGALWASGVAASANACACCLSLLCRCV